MKKRIFLGVALSWVMLFVIGVSNPVQAQKKPIEARWAVEMVIADIDPANQRHNWEYLTAVNLYDTLIFPDAEKGYIPWIAESWKVSPDGKTYTFQLKKGIPFHDGTEITAEDVAFSMDRILQLGSKVATYFKSLQPKTTKVLDKYTVQFNLTKKDPSFMQALFLFKIVNKQLVLKNKAEGNFGEFGDYGVKFLLNHDAGSGPYMAVENKLGDHVTMKRFNEYPFVQWKPNSIDVITVYMIPEMVTIAMKLKKGEVDMAAWSLDNKIQRELQSNPNFKIEEDTLPAPWQLVLNNKKKPLDDIYVRKAIAYAFDRHTVMDLILAGGKPTAGPLPPELQGGCTDIATYPFDLEKAKEMLAKSKYSAEELKSFNMEIAAAAGSERFQKVALLTSSNLKKIGLNAQVKVVRYVDICQYQAKPETAYHMVVFYHPALVPHPYQYLIFYTPEGAGTAWPPGGIYYENPQVTEWINKGNNASDLKEQRRYYCEAQKQIALDSPVVWSHTELRLMPKWRYVKGWQYPVGSMFFELRHDRYTMDTDDPMFRKNHGW